MMVIEEKLDKNENSIGCVDSSVVEYQLCAPWTRVQLPVQEPR